MDTWKQNFKDKWKYEKTQVIYEDKDGAQVTPIPSTTSTTTRTPGPDVTTKQTPGTSSPSVVTVDITTKGPHTGEVITADTSTLIKTVGITCGALIVLILLIVICICCCRRSAAKRNRRMTVRRPLNPAEPEVDHIYAEIEPLQRSTGSSGASGTSDDVRLPKKKGKGRKSGVSSFRYVTTRIAKFFSVDEDEGVDDQTVSYNRSGHKESASFGPPVPPDRNGRSTKKSRNAVSRGESTASRRHLLDGDSVERRSHVYNPLTREEKGRQSGPYDRLAISRELPSDEVEEPSSPHDYFMLNKEGKVSDPEEYHAHSVDTVKEDIEDDLEIIDEENKDTVGERVSKHDYFVLEPHEKEEETFVGKCADVDQSGKRGESGSVRSNSNGSPTKTVGSGGGVGDGRPEAKPRVSKQTSEHVLSGSLPRSPVKVDKKSEFTDKTPNGDNIVRMSSVDETYVLSKLGEAPLPPPGLAAGSVIGSEGCEAGTDDYLVPKDIPHPDYLDVFPAPPLRTHSLPLKDVDVKNPSMEVAPTNYINSTTKHPKVPVGNYEPLNRHNINTSPTKHHKSSSKQPKSPSRDSKSPVRHKTTPDTESPKTIKDTVQKKESIITDI
ncbi:uncharacterized protein LOC127877385 isoform X2 [Dreissena polymorpha]|uniref:uncharacterized protein LOC127877385 isoform X2 n=1 Tax=Dreissena polymorpha TaxID=45954 RepID=UPI0022655C8A|nr:uncharacterized protein LOC127877385 isoform X2 [Dreissena polymorpha]